MVGTAIQRLLTHAGLVTGLIACAGVISYSAFAVETQPATPSESITLSPASKSYDLKAGEEKRDLIKIINDGQTDFDFITYARPYSVRNEAYKPDFTTDKNNADAYKWIQFDKASFSIKAGKTVEVPYTVRVPSDAAPGGHYGVLFAETQPKDATGGNAVKRKKRVGSILYITVDGDVKLKGSLLATSIPTFQLQAPVAIAQRIKNTGNTDFEVTSNVQVSDIFGGLKYKNEHAYNVLPKTTRNFAMDWQDPAWMGVYKVSVTTQYLDTTTTENKYVILVPLWVYLTFFLLIGARIVYGYALSRRKR